MAGDVGTTTARRPGGSGRRPKRHTSERTCAARSCHTRLSSYNQREYCFTHWKTRYPRLRGVDTQPT
jgi:hypothetical protein